MKNQSEIMLCPNCGMDACCGEYELSDGTVCKNCEAYLRFAYPITYIPNPHPDESRRPDLSGLFEGEGLTNRQKADMIEELRELPLNRADPNPKSYYTVDRMHALTVKEFMHEAENAQILRNKLLVRYNDYDNVCTVVSVEPLRQLRATQGIMEMKRLQGTLVVQGMLRLGKFRVGDSVTLLHDGSEAGEAEILEAGYTAGCIYSGGTFSLSGSLQKVIEGHQVRVLLSRRAAGILPGDLIVTDD